MRIDRTFDMDLVRRIFTHPSIYPHITDDSAPPPDQYQPPESDALYYLTPVEAEVMGVFLVHPHNAITYEVHTCILPEFWGKGTAAMARALIAWVMSNTPCRKLITHVPEKNKHALRLALKAGMQHEGVNRASWLKNGVVYDQYLLGITRAETCQQQHHS